MPPEGIKPGPDRQDYPSIIPGLQLSNIWLIYCAYELIYIQTIHVFEGHCEWRVSLGSTREREREKESHSQTDLFNKWGHIGTSHIQMNGNLLIFDHIRRTTHHTHTHPHKQYGMCDDFRLLLSIFCSRFSLFGIWAADRTTSTWQPFSFHIDFYPYLMDIMVEWHTHTTDSHPKRVS